MSEACKELTTQLGFTTELYSTYVALCVINGLFSVTASIGNLLVILAIYKTGSLHTPSYVLLSALALSDLGIGLVAQPLYIAFKVAEINEQFEMYCYLGIAWHVIALFLAGFSFLTITAISIDRYLAVYLYMKYRLVVTVRRVLLASTALALLALLISLMYVLHMAANLFAQTLVIVVCLFLTSFNSVKIIRMLHQHQKVQTISFGNASSQTVSANAVPRHQHSTAFNIGRFKKSVYILLYVYGTFLLCYLPYLCYRIALIIVGRTATVHSAFSVCSTIVFVNSSLNPPLYLWRVPEIRIAVLRILRCNTLYVRQQLEVTVTVMQSKWRGNDNCSTILAHSPNLRSHKTAWVRRDKNQPNFYMSNAVSGACQ